MEEKERQEGNVETLNPGAEMKEARMKGRKNTENNNYRSERRERDRGGEKPAYCWEKFLSLSPLVKSDMAGAQRRSGCPVLDLEK